MPMIYLPKKFIQNCQRYLEKNPRAGDDVGDFVARCGRLGLYYLEKLLTPEEARDCPGDNRGRGSAEILDSGGEEEGEKVPIYLPDRDFERVKSLVVKKLGITTTATAWYLLCVFMVMYGYWELPPKV
jgi:hypothetical protein